MRVSYSHLHLYLRMTDVVDEFKVREFEVLDLRNFGINLKLWEGIRVALKLFLKWVNMIFINVGISKTMDELTSS